MCSRDPFSKLIHALCIYKRSILSYKGHKDNNSWCETQQSRLQQEETRWHSAGYQKVPALCPKPFSARPRHGQLCAQTFGSLAFFRSLGSGFPILFPEGCSIVSSQSSLFLSSTTMFCFCYPGIHCQVRSASPFSVAKFFKCSQNVTLFFVSPAIYTSGMQLDVA